MKIRFYVNWEKEHLILIFKNKNGDKEMFRGMSCLISNWIPFLNIIRPGYENGEYLILDYAEDGKTLMFYNPFIREDGWRNRLPIMRVTTPDKFKEALKDVINIENNEEIIKKDDISVKEQLESLNKEKEKLEDILKKQKKHEQTKKITDEIYLLFTTLQESGFTRKEALAIIIASMSSNNDQTRQTIKHADLHF